MWDLKPKLQGMIHGAQHLAGKSDIRLERCLDLQGSKNKMRRSRFGSGDDAGSCDE